MNPAIGLRRQKVLRAADFPVFPREILEKREPEWVC
jgi:hypothetical protein